MTEQPEKPRPTLSSILTAMQMFDEAIVIDFDSAEVVAGDLKDKVDAIKVVIDRLEFQAEWCRQKADPFMKSAYALERNVKRLREYVLYQMQQGEFDTLPGNTYRAQLQNNPPSLELTQPECSALDYQRYPNYVKQIRFYEWDKTAIKDALISKRRDVIEECATSGVPAPNDRSFTAEAIPFAKLAIGQQLRFYVNLPEGTKKGKKA